MMSYRITVELNLSCLWGVFTFQNEEKLKVDILLKKHFSFVELVHFNHLVEQTLSELGF